MLCIELYWLIIVTITNIEMNQYLHHSLYTMNYIDVSYIMKIIFKL